MSREFEAQPSFADQVAEATGLAPVFASGVIERCCKRAHVLVSYHGGREYSDVPAQEPLDVAKAVMAAGADAMLGHHPHVPQGIGWFGDRPAIYSLGNLVFGKYRDDEWTARSFVARLTFGADRRIELAACPYIIDGGVPKLAAGSGWSGWETAFRAYLRRSSSYASIAGTEVGSPDELGCLPVHPGLHVLDGRRSPR